MDELEMRKVTRPIREKNHVRPNRRLVTIHTALARLPSKVHYNFKSPLKALSNRKQMRDVKIHDI